MRFLSLVLVLCGISFGGERWDYSGSIPNKFYVEDVDTIIQTQETNMNNASDRQTKAMEQTAEDVNTMKNIMTFWLVLFLGVVVISVAQSI